MRKQGSYADVVNGLIEVSQGYAILKDTRRALAFANALDAFRDHYIGRDVSGVTVQELQRLQNIGKGSAETIVQIVRTGTCDRIKMIRDQGIPSLADLFRVKGIGPATARALWFENKISTVDGLKKALVKRQIRNSAVLARIEKISLDLQKTYGGSKRPAPGEAPFLLASDYVGECEDLHPDQAATDYNWMAVLQSGG